VKALLHVDPTTNKLVGVWAGPKPTLGETLTMPTSFYAGTSFQHADAVRRMQQRAIGPDGLPVGTWDEWANYLAGETPYGIHWMTTDMTKSESAQDVYNRMSTISK
jgi:hypothetical protein